MEERKYLRQDELLEHIKDDVRYTPLTPEYWKNGLSQKSQVKHWEAKKWKWEKENAEAIKENGKIYKEYMLKQRKGEDISIV